VRLAHLAQIMPALRLVHSRPVRRVSVAEAAAAANLSRAQFSLVFKRSMGLTFGEFRLRARLALVADRLLNTHLSTDAIAQETGFTDASHLHRSFQKRFGCTPAQYRERAQSAVAAPPFGLGPAGAGSS
jgi:AraC family transcriptional regulator